VKYRVSRVVAAPFLRGLWRPQITGTEHIPPTGGAILASNHLSIFDSIFLPFLVTRPVTFAAKSEYFTGTSPAQRFTAAYMRATKQLSVEREGARAAQETLQAALDLVKAGELFGIYPEGTRSPDGRLYRRPDRSRLACPCFRGAGHPGRHGRHRPGAAARACHPNPAPGRGANRQAAHVR
jgi:1-acyl-sn-glycerol-3-phosphate acyltransferase